MNLGQIKTRVRRKFGDEAQVQVTDDDIKSWVNDGQRHIVTKTETLLQKIELLNSTAQLQEYAIPGDVFLIRSVTFKYYDSYNHLKNLDLTKFDEYMDGADGDTTLAGKPCVYTIFDSTLRLYPIPDKTITSGIKIYYSRFPVDVISDIDNPDLPAEYHNALVNYVMQQAYELDEDWDASNNKAAQVQNDIHLNLSRQDREATETYPLISTKWEDMWYA